MNSIQSINNRLLRLFPVNYIKDTFSSELRVQNDIINDILERFDHNDIYLFANSNINITKQSVYIYHTRNIYQHRNLIEAEDLGLEICSQQLVDGSLYLDGYNDILVEVKLLDEDKEYSELQIRIKQPYQVIVNGQYLIIKLTKVESNLRSYLGADLEVLKSKKMTEDSEAIHNILTYFDSQHHVVPQKADLNRGVKYLWDQDHIDSREVAYRKDASRATEIMDENSLYKEIYPDDYLELMGKPLENCTFRYLLEDQAFPEHFICDATNGTLSFNIFPKGLEQVNAVINEIIRNN